MTTVFFLFLFHLKIAPPLDGYNLIINLAVVGYYLRINLEAVGGYYIRIYQRQ